MKKIMIGILAAAAMISACKKTSTSTTSGSIFSGCYNDYYYYTYPGGATDTLHVTSISDDSVSYTVRSGGIDYVYCYKIKGDSVSVRRYDGPTATLTFHGTSFLNAQGFSISDHYFQQSGAVSSTGTNTYNSDGRPTHTVSSYTSYVNDYTNYYDANGNKTYSIFNQSGISNYRDSAVYVYDLTKTNKFVTGYPSQRLFGKPDNNLVTQMRRYDTPSDTLKITSDYTYVVDANGYITQKNTHTVYAGSGLIYDYIERFITQCP